MLTSFPDRIWIPAVPVISSMPGSDRGLGRGFLTQGSLRKGSLEALPPDRNVATSKLSLATAYDRPSRRPRSARLTYVLAPTIT